MNSLVARTLHDLCGCEADPLVHHLHPDIAGLDGDLLGAVAVTVEAGLAHQDLERAPELGGDAAYLGPGSIGCGARRFPRRDAYPRHPGRRPVLTEEGAQHVRPLPGRDPRM